MQQIVVTVQSIRDLCVLYLPGAGDSKAESEGGERQTAGPARALQEVFNTTQHSLGQRPSQRSPVKVTIDPNSKS